MTQLFGQMVGSPEMQRGFFWLTSVVVILAWLFLRWVVRGRFGDVLIAIRDDEPRLRFAGYNPTLFKTIVFAIAGGLAGIGGALYTVQSGIVSPQYMTVEEIEENKQGRLGEDREIDPLDPVTEHQVACLLYTSPSPRDRQKSRMPSSA